MSIGLIRRSELQGIADAIRSKTSSSATYKPREMAAAIARIRPTLVTKTITVNGNYDPADDSADGYSNVAVNVGGGGSVISPKPNFACNWDFTNPVNTAGQTSYSTEGNNVISVIDGWKLQAGVLNIVSGGIKLSRCISDTAGYLIQYFGSKPIEGFMSDYITLSAYVDGVGNAVSVRRSDSGDWVGGIVTLFVSGVSFRIYGYTRAYWGLTIDIANGNEDKLIQAIKIEAGQTQTLYDANGLIEHQDAASEKMKILALLN